MLSVTTERFRKCYSKLPDDIKQQVKSAYVLWKKNPQHPSLHFKLVHNSEPIYSVRIGLKWRSLGIKENNTMVWFWIGSHEEYNKML